MKKITSPTAKKALSATVNPIHVGTLNLRQHASLNRHYSKVSSIHTQIGVDPPRMILDMASSVTANPVLRLDCSSQC